MNLAGHPRSQVMGMWTSDLGLEFFHHKSMFERRKNLTGITVVNTVLPWVPLSIVDEDVNLNVYQSGKFWRILHYRSILKLC